MNLLIFTQKVDIDDPVLGFFHRWIEEFSKHFEKVSVVCLYKGKYDLPKNVEVFSLGKEEGKSKFTYIYRFYKYIFTLKYDSVFVHMNQIYVILGGLFWRLSVKKVGLWYAHGHVPFSLRIAEKLTNNIFTSTESGFRLKSKKKNVVGQGIDTDLFGLKNDSKNEKFEIISVGRISPVKDYETLINSIKILADKNINVTIIGDVGLVEQKKYFSELKKSAAGLNVHFTGGISNNEIVDYLQKSDLFINTSHTGSLDKAILEAMSVGLPVLTCNEALIGILGEYEDSLMFSKENSEALVEKIKYIMNMKNSSELGKSLRNIVVENHSIKKFIEKIVKRYVF